MWKRIRHYVWDTLRCFCWAVQLLLSSDIKGAQSSIDIVSLNSPAVVGSDSKSGLSRQIHSQ